MGEKISQLISASILDGSELIETVQGGNSRRTTTQDIANLGSGGVTIYTGDGAYPDNEARTIDQNGGSTTFINGNVGVGGSPTNLFEVISTGVDPLIKIDNTTFLSKITANDGISTNAEMSIQADILGSAVYFLTAASTGSNSVSVYGEAVAQTISLTATNGIILSDLVGGGTTGLSIDNAGKIIRGGGVPDTAYASNAAAVAALGVGVIYKTTSVGPDLIQPLLSITV